MTRQPAHAIGAAVRDCLAECRQAEMPLSALCRYTCYLQSRQWAARDIRTVEKTALRILACLTEHSAEMSEHKPNRSRSDQ
jgi:hypothetical protein